jgi:hypothetical protein
MAGFIFDKTGSYFIAFVFVMLFLIAGGLAAAMMKKPPYSTESTP